MFCKALSPTWAGVGRVPSLTLSLALALALSLSHSLTHLGAARVGRVPAIPVLAFLALPLPRLSVVGIAAPSSCIAVSVLGI